MNTFAKTLLTSTLIAAPALAADGATTPPATQPATQPSGTVLVQSNEPLVIPDGTSLQNPGPTFRNRGKFDDEEMDISGLRR